MTARDVLAPAYAAAKNWHGGLDYPLEVADAILAADPALNDALELGLAWAEATEALPEGRDGTWRGGKWDLRSLTWSVVHGWCATAWNYEDRIDATGPTATAALTNLADRLREKAR